MILRSSGIAAGAVLVALALVACGSSDSDTAADAPSSTSAQAAGSSTATPTPTVPDLPAPDTQVLQDSLARFVDPAVPAPEKAALVVGGDKYIAQIDTLNGGLQNYGRITFVVNAVEVHGTTAVAQVDVTTPHTPTIPMNNMTWDNVDGQWKIAESTVCNLLAFGQAACPAP